MPIAGAVDEHDDVAFSFHADKVRHRVGSNA
jgi:hypothetical protein